MLQMMVVSVVQQRTRELSHRGVRTRQKRQQQQQQQQQQTALAPDLGTLLFDFMNFFGRQLNTRDVGISVRNGGFFFRKRDRPGDWGAGNVQRMSIENPDEPSTDLGRGSYRFDRVRVALDHAHQVLARAANNEWIERNPEKFPEAAAALRARRDATARAQHRYRKFSEDDGDGGDDDGGGGGDGGDDDDDDGGGGRGKGKRNGGGGDGGKTLGEEDDMKATRVTSIGQSM